MTENGISGLTLVYDLHHAFTGFCRKCGGDVFPICDAHMLWSAESQKWTIRLPGSPWLVEEDCEEDGFPIFGKDLIEKLPGALSIKPVSHETTKDMAGRPMLELLHMGCLEEWFLEGHLEWIPKSSDGHQFYTIMPPPTGS